MRERDYEDLLDAIIGMLEVLYKAQIAPNDAFMDMVLRKAGYNRDTYMFLPFIKQELYYYNYMRPGSNMYRYHLGEKI